MKTLKTLFVIVVVLCVWQPLFSQTDDKKDFKITGKKPTTVQISKAYSADADLSPFGSKAVPVYGLALTADVTFTSDKGVVRVIMLDENYQEYLVTESYPLLDQSGQVSLDAIGEETSGLAGIKPLLLRVEVKDASVNIRSLTYTTSPEPGVDLTKAKKDKKVAQNAYKIKKLNQGLSAAGATWKAGATSVSELSYADRKKLYGQGTFPAGFEYYTGGVIEAGTSLKSTSGTSLMADKWDWRDRHGMNWVTPVKNQGGCGSCWAFAATGATEALANLYFNQNTLNFDLSEQDVLSCSGGGSCGGGYPSTALNYITTNGIVDEEAFPYSGTDEPCANKSTTPAQQIKISGRVDFGSADFPATEDNLKKMIIKYGPISGGLYDWSHAMTLVGWQVVVEGDNFVYRDLTRSVYWITVPAGSPLIGKTVWIFKNSWGNWGDAGYVYVETAITNVGWTHGLVTPVQSIKQPLTVTCTDADGDGYYWWGLGAKPASCPPCPAQPDGDDSNASLGPLDEYGNCLPIVEVPVLNDPADETIISGATTNIPLTATYTGGEVLFTWTASGSSADLTGFSDQATTIDGPIAQKLRNHGSAAAKVTYTVTPVSGAINGIPVNVEVTVAPAPVADFSADQVSVPVSSMVAMKDLSVNNPTHWTWTFVGGTPASSTEQNPVVGYDIPGSFDVILTVSNEAGETSTMTRLGYITVMAEKPAYCESKGLVTKEYINSVTLNKKKVTSGSSGAAGYQEFPDNGFVITPGATSAIAVALSFTGKTDVRYLSVWIDFNQDADFDDPGEIVISAGKIRTSVSGRIGIPSDALPGTTRMRVSLKSGSQPTPCEIFTGGEVEDYVITVSAGKSGIIADAEAGLPTLKLYPNPASNLLNIQLTEVQDQARYAIYNFQGQLVLMQNINDAVTQVNLQSLNAGMYFVVVYNGDLLFREKIVKN